MKRFALLWLIAALVIVSACSKSNVGDRMEHGDNGDHASTHEMDHASKNDTIATSAVWKLSSDKPQPNSDTAITIEIQDNKGQAVDSFDINHEKKMHLIVVSRDLSYFNHIHPEYESEGKFVVTTQLPSAGDYKLFADYVPAGGLATTQSNWITVEGIASEPAAIVPEESLVKTVNDIEVTLSFDHLMANMDLGLTFQLVDAATKKPITDLQPYLGAVGHVVIISEDAEQYLHVHPTDEKVKGPDAKFMTQFPRSGVYKIWGQFQRDGKTFIVPFVVNVP